ncbi:YraN family protein [Candidatus Hydrogenosomobacter endosymbioticus]|uniref:UPF0102 protein HYD_6010 n=1 Tax=Candidatus Hydrogenosomobacter endosymbioticus TaxID=2558174 RepID=A0ABM7V9M5_9PROT|nr:YraN family protein [Candidatus Hydrogenosomobacter endosymbioticus]BDB96468.1 UPF0102 protein [Candidatus Hydrogenosomobacter endosymbioticus]
MAGMSYRTGVEGERLACEFLERRGYGVLQRRYKTKAGEIDLVMKDKDAIVFVEVKKRKKMADAAEALSRTQFNRIADAAAIFTGSSDVECSEIRFDLVCMSSDGNINHIKNISMDFCD